MKINKNQVVILGGIAIAVLVIWLVAQSSKNKKLKNENDFLRESNRIIIEEMLENTDDIPKDVKEQLERLVLEYESLAPKVSKELVDVLKLLNNGMSAKALSAMSKIVEVLLKEKYGPKKSDAKYKDLTDEAFEKKRKSFSFAKAIKLASENNLLSQIECDLLDILRGYRNEETHTFVEDGEKNWKQIAFLTALEVVFKVKGTLRKSSTTVPSESLS